MFLLSAIVLAVSCQVISSEPPPECRGPPAGVDERPHDCCKIPPFFEDKDIEECGFVKPDGRGPPPGKPIAPPDCSKELCLADKYGLTTDGAIDHEKISKFWDTYAEKNEVFAPTIASAKERCLFKTDLPGPPHVCETTKVVFCMMHTLLHECPVWEKTEGCTALKEHMEQCKPHFEKH